MLDLNGVSLQGTYPLGLKETKEVEGGTILGPNGYDDNTAWGMWHDTTGIVVQAPDCEIRNTNLVNVGDGIALSSRVTRAGVRLASDNCKIERVSVLKGHDDCLEDDEMRSFSVKESRFEGLVFLSTQSPNGARDGSENLVTITDTVARLRPYYNTYKPLKYGYNQHGGLFKTPVKSMIGIGDGTYGVPPKIVLNNCIFFASMIPKYGGTIGCPPNISGDKITLCWEGEGVWPQQLVDEWKAQCTNVTVMSNKRYWEYISGIWTFLYRP